MQRRRAHTDTQRELRETVLAHGGEAAVHVGSPSALRWREWASRPVGPTLFARTLVQKVVEGWSSVNPKVVKEQTAWERQRAKPAV